MKYRDWIRSLINGSVMRYLSIWSVRIGGSIIVYAVIMFTVAFLTDKAMWAGHITAIFMAGVGLVSAGIAGKGFQKRYENNHIEKLEKICGE